MSYKYTWTDVEKTSLRREDKDGNVAFIPVDPGNHDYAKFLSSKAKPAAYVEPPAPKTLTAKQKLEAAGLTVAELKQLLR